jgi:hypothetical protein
MVSLFRNPSIRHTQENVADLERTLILRFFMKLLKREDGFLQKFLQVFWVLIKKLSEHERTS